ncbi:hypothetical protein HRD49_36195 [Corallococcus exiguus]|uniref:DUF6310 domain-containing protein n=1 Tax=Corallococcus TaxID=83461 RepID=UPI000EA3A116|nr:MULTISPECIES: DUF6310 domain-containing protein [Corallococcus]NNC21945.1 hypothetical protein [Corallococcus exiguus]NRD59196.1 hypothetical protein [Corallococcus exiguus]NRD67200.1 hypothetical protein [Corallococcus exiguus]RKH20180.1 hypothetical protein D7V77_31400 [Corallococcus sp. CA041A]RKI01122.1 hypothetical protein D7Y15_36545 [Corallococcus sp. AB030]
MRFLAATALLLFLSACATSTPQMKAPAVRESRFTNLQRAATLPWRDEGKCVVREASQPWDVVVERCFQALDSRRIRFEDSEHRCPVASADAAALQTMVGVCLLTQPEIVVGAVIVIGVVVVAVAIAEELEAYELRHAYPDEDAPRTQPLTQQSVVEHGPDPTGRSSGQDWFPPPGPPSSAEPRERRPECIPKRVPPKGGHPLHNRCADGIPGNTFRGANALVNGKAYDGLQSAFRTLWEVKTDNFDTYSAFLRRTVPEKQLMEMRHERDLARACGFDFRVGVRSAAHQEALEIADPDLEGTIILMEWCKDDEAEE